MGPSSPPPIRAALFDMDGLLIDSEDMYTRSTNEILQKYGKPNIPWSIKSQLQGRPAPEAGKIFHAWAQLPITTEEFVAQNQALQAEYFLLTKPLAGVEVLLRTLSETTQPQVHMALATSSQQRNFRLKTGHLQDLFSVFPHDRRVLGDDKRIAPGRGKPAPDIYLVALKTINDGLRDRGEHEIKPEECLVFEDSVPGVEAGRRAGMQVIWCPHPELLIEYRGREKEVLAGLTGEHQEDKTQGDAENSEGKPGKIDDGWGTLLHSLVDFPYEKYGIKVAS